MKKFLLTILAAASAAGCLWAHDIVIGSSKGIDLSQKEAAKAMESPMQSRASSGYTLRFCDTPYNWYALGDAYELRCAIRIPAEFATQLAGNKVSTIGLSVSFDERTTAPGKICVWADENGRPGTELATRSITLRNSYLSAPYYQTGTFASASQYEIQENTPFWFGFSYECLASDYPICIDGNAAGNFAGYVFAYDKDQYIGYINIAQSIGSNMFLYAITTGEKTSLENIFQVGYSIIGNYTLPIVTSNDSPEVQVIVANIGTNALTEAEYTYFYTTAEGNTEPVSAKAEINLAGNTTDFIALPVEDMPIGRGSVTTTVDKINGVESGVISTAFFMNIGDSEGYPRKMVVEEGTGTWCGWCPRGIVGMDYMAETYPEEFIGIAVHSGDKFAANSYAPIVSEFFDGFPNCVVNRDPIYVMDPNKDYLELAYQLWKPQASPASLALDVFFTDDDNVLKAQTTTAFALSEEDSKYQLGYVVIEDHLSGSQTNNYAGGKNGECGGWETYSNPQRWDYMHTARSLTQKDFAYTSIEASKEYTIQEEIDLTDVTDIANTKIVALLIDGTTGTILNAAEVAYADYRPKEEDGIANVAVDTNAPAVFYNIQGQRVENPKAGTLYIRVQGANALKVAY